ncbi:MAG TPA: hypothetical protein VMC04_24040 [Verrucomicrobiae bacterium]|jgi:hypothetical protein|nr:hypothetical protein [Verrucomicrobiae bacterium]
MDGHPIGRPLPALGLIALLLAMAPVPAHAGTPRLHDLHAHEVARSVAPGGLSHAVLPAGLLLLAALVLLGALGWWRRASPRSRGGAVAVALSLVLTVFALETARHSVHHLTDPKSGADCSVLSGSQGLAWGGAEPVGTDGPRLDFTTAPPVRSEHDPWWHVYRPSPGRAPPA